MLVTALVAAFVALLSQHLGLMQEFARIFTKISRCPKCTTMWVTLGVLILCGYEILVAAALSLIMAYLSYWLGLILIIFQAIYNKLWQRLQRKI